MPLAVSKDIGLEALHIWDPDVRPGCVVECLEQYASFPGGRGEATTAFLKGDHRVCKKSQDFATRSSH